MIVGDRCANVDYGELEHAERFDLARFGYYQLEERGFGRSGGS